MGTSCLGHNKIVTIKNFTPKDTEGNQKLIERTISIRGFGLKKENKNSFRKLKQIICKHCQKEFHSNNERQIVFFCSPECRKAHRHDYMKNYNNSYYTHKNLKRAEKEKKALRAKKEEASLPLQTIFTGGYDLGKETEGLVICNEGEIL